MKKLLILGLFIISGCYTETYWRDTEAGKAELVIEADHRAMLKDGKIYIGMSSHTFAELWGRPYDSWIDRSTSIYGTSEWWWFWRAHDPCSPGKGKYAFHFENGLLDYWSEN